MTPDCPPKRPAGSSAAEFWFSTLGCPELSLLEALRLGAEHGFAGVEIRALAGLPDLREALVAEFGTPARAVQRLKARRCRVMVISSALKLAQPSPSSRHEFEALLPWAEALGAKWMRAFDGGEVAQAGVVEEARRTVDWWRELRDRTGTNLRLLMETHDGIVTVDRIRAFAVAAPDVDVLWDPHNAWKRSGEDYLAAADALAGLVSHVHLKDSIARPSARHPFTYVLPGDGEFAGGEVMQRLRAGGYRGAFSLEWERRWHPYLAPLPAAMAAWWKNWSPRAAGAATLGPLSFQSSHHVC